MARHQLPVNPGHDVLVFVEEGNVAAGQARSRHRNPLHQNPVAHQNANERGDLGPHALVPEIKQAHDQIADGDPLQHAVDAQMFQVEEGCAVDDDSQEK